jgi:hypothetical protein
MFEHTRTPSIGKCCGFGNRNAGIITYISDGAKDARHKGRIKNHQTGCGLQGSGPFTGGRKRCAADPAQERTGGEKDGKKKQKTDDEKEQRGRNAEIPTKICA